ncbi:MAG: GNAT family N-acetyltransferase [Polyangiales bacterium]
MPAPLPSLDRLPTLRATRGARRWLEDHDVPALYEVFSDPEVMRYWSRGPFTEHDEARLYLDSIRESFASRSLFQWGIVRVDDDTVVGTCTLASIDVGHRRAEIGYALGRRSWGAGLVTEAVTRVLDFAFDELSLHRIEADVDPRNARSIRTLERLGFTREGLLRERWHVAGEICDAAFYGLLAGEWYERRARRAGQYSQPK